MKRFEMCSIGKTLSEISPLNPIANNTNESSSYGSFLPSFIFFRNSETKPNNNQAFNRDGNHMGSIGYTTLVQFIDTNDLTGLKSFLDNRQLLIDDRDENGTTALMVAANKGLTLFVREFLTRGADIQAEDFDNWTALLFAAKSGYLDIVQTLLDHGADIEQRDMGGWSALLWSAYRGHTEVTQFLLERGADINVHGNFHLGPLLWAAGRGHKNIVEQLIKRGAKVNVGDKYGTTALVWACRKGNADIVEMLLKVGANVDTAGMYSWTPLLVSVLGGFIDCVSLLLERKPNVNALDKDGMTALTIACREGMQEIATALLAAGAYINIPDRMGDTPLIHAIKGGYRGIVEALLKKHADVDIQGKERKSALYTAIEKGHTSIVKLLLSFNPDLELSTKDGDTPLIKAVRNRNLEMVQLLLEKKAKVGASDKRGDTCLHIAMRARSKAIVEALLRNPKNSQLLYRANKSGETPYGIDALHQKTILGQVFGARRLNTNEDSEGMLGYELYSAALADVLSEPTLTTPITVGLYAKWGSGKSFLLTKLRNEMKNFAEQWAEPTIKAPWLLFCICLHLSIWIGVIVGLICWSWILGISAGLLFFITVYGIYLSIKFASRKYDVYWAYSLHRGIMKRLGNLRLVIQVIFCHPPGAECNFQNKPIRFHFAEASSATPTGESAIAYMLASLYEAIENHYGTLSTRLYRVFRPKPIIESSSWRWRRVCCIPLIFTFELGLLIFTIGVALLTAYFTYYWAVDNGSLTITIYILWGLLGTGMCANLHIWIKATSSVLTSQGRQLRKAIKFNEGAPLTVLGEEVSLMADMVKCLDGFSNQQSRLVGIVDALDSCDTERILSALNAIQTLLSSPNRPFVILIAVDPHVIAKAAEANSRRLFTEGGIGGHDFLRNLIHLPVYLQNSGFRKIQRAQITALAYKRNHSDYQNEESTLGHSVSARRLSNASEIMSSQEKLRGSTNANRGSKKLRVSESLASSVGSNLHRIGQNPQCAADISRLILTDDYFSDVNPRSMRRFMNVLYVTVRLLKAFQIDFSWYRLSSWVNLTEQWPLRVSMMVIQHDESQDSLDDNTPMLTLYDKIRSKISSLREAASLLELDRDERKLETFLLLHKSDMQVADLRIFLPFTINLDPYLRKVLKEDQQTLEEEGSLIQTNAITPATRNQNTKISSMTKPHPIMPYDNICNSNPNINLSNEQNLKNSNSSISLNLMQENDHPFQEDILNIRLSDLSVDKVITLLSKVDELQSALPKLVPILNQNAISGRVLKHCNLNELKSVLMLNFGQWEIFKLLICTLRNKENNRFKANKLVENKNVDVTDTPCSVISHPRKSSSHMEKQVTLEEQMIYGTLQTLNEEAFEDVVSSERPNSSTLTQEKGSSVVTSADIPVSIHKESILKSSGYPRVDKHVSISRDNGLTQMEYLCEKPIRQKLLPGSRPLQISSKASRHQNKLVRSSSVDFDEIQASKNKTDEENCPLFVIRN